MNLGLLKNSYQFLLLIFENFELSDDVFERNGSNDNSDAFTLMTNLHMPEINKKVFHLILLNIFNEIILEKNSEHFNNGKHMRNLKHIWSL